MSEKLSHIHMQPLVNMRKILTNSLSAEIAKLEAFLKEDAPGMAFEQVVEDLKGIAAAPVRVDSTDVIDQILPNISSDAKEIAWQICQSFANDIAASLLAPKLSSERLTKLRAAIAELGVDAFIIPLNDEFHGEAAPAASERLKWLTGFTGSAGVAAITADEAAIFVDGRYTLQVRSEVNTDLFTPRHVTDEPMTAWFKDVLDAGNTVGIDPWLHTESALNNLRSALDNMGIGIKSLSPNPIDTIWEDRPQQPLALVVPHNEEFAGKSSRDKRAEISENMSAEGVDTTVHTLPDVTAWLLNMRGADLPSTPFPLGFATLHNDETVDLFISEKKISSDLKQHLGNGVRLHEPAEFKSHLSSLNGKKVQLDPTTTSQWIVDQLNAANATILRKADPCMLPKAIKNETEKAGTRTAHIRDGVAVAKFLHWLHIEAPGGDIDELNAEQKLYDFRAEGENFKDTSFSTISGSGPNGAIVHYRSSPATNRKLEKDSLYLVDSGGQYLDGTTDITRTIAVGTASDEMKKRFTHVLKGHIALALSKFPAGTTGNQLDTLARAPLWTLGLDYDHGTGHGVGSYLSVHEGPQRISKMPSTIALQPGMILSNEPGYYKTGEYGIRIENLVMVQNEAAPDGAERELLSFETLTFAPIDKNVIEKTYLTSEEVAWLNGYHKDVWEKVSPYLEGDVKDWLSDATSPL